MSGNALTVEAMILDAINETDGMRKYVIKKVAKWFGISEARVGGVFYGWEYKPFSEDEEATAASKYELYLEAREAQLEERKRKLRVRLDALQQRKARYAAMEASDTGDPPVVGESAHIGKRGALDGSGPIKPQGQAK